MKEINIEEPFARKKENGDICRYSTFYFIEENEEHNLDKRKAYRVDMYPSDLSELRLMVNILEDNGWNKEVLCRKKIKVWHCKIFTFKK